jgi:hypothetical protein
MTTAAGRERHLPSPALFCSQIIISIGLSATPISTLTTEYHMENCTPKRLWLMGLHYCLHQYSSYMTDRNTTCTQFSSIIQYSAHPLRYLHLATQISHHQSTQRSLYFAPTPFMALDPWWTQLVFYPPYTSCGLGLWRNTQTFRRYLDKPVAGSYLS